MSRTKSAFLGIISSQIYTIVSIFLSLLAAPIIINHLNSEIYGLSIIIFQIMSYLGLFDFGLTAGVDRYLAGTRGDTEENKENLKRIISTCLIVYAVIAFIMIIVGNIFAPFAAFIFSAPKNYTHSIYYIVASISVLTGLQLVLRAVGGIFFAHQKQFLANTLSFVLNISSVLFTLLFVFEGFGLWSFVYSQVIVLFLNAALNIYFFRKHYPYIDFKIKYFDYVLLKKIFSYGFSLFIITISVQVIFQTDRILVGSFISLTAVSIYSLSTKIPELITQFLWKVTDNSFPAIVEISNNDTTKAFTDVHNKLMNITLTLSSLIFWYILLASSPFITLWVGNKFYAGNTFLLIVAYLYLVQHTFIHVTAMCLNAAGIAKKIAFMYFLEAVLNIVISILLIKRYQIEGVVLGTIISGLVTSVWYIPYLAIDHMKSNLFSYLKSIFKPLLIGSVPGGILYLLLYKSFNMIHNWVALILFSTLFFVASMIPLVYFNKSLLKTLKNKLGVYNADKKHL